jgi:two-component system, LuxR family, response regulator FixJ
MNDVPIIAIVDDDASVRGSLLHVVESGGYQAKAFTSAREFLAWLPNGQAACLVLDAHMNELSGLDLNDRLKVPIVFITGHDDAATRAGIARATVSGHLRKPFDRRTVLDTIQRVVGAPHVRLRNGPDGADGHPSGGTRS